jgi:hypothetical protein
MTFTVGEVACLFAALEKLRGRSVVLGSCTLLDSVAAYVEEAQTSGALSRTESGIVLDVCAKFRGCAPEILSALAAGTAWFRRVGQQGFRIEPEPTALT